MKKPLSAKSEPAKTNIKEKAVPSSPAATVEAIARPNPREFAQIVAREIVKNLSTIGKLRPFSRETPAEELKDITVPEGENLILVDTSVLVDGRILPIVNSGFLTGTLVIAEFILGEIQHIADSSDSLRRAKGRRGLEVVGKLKGQRVNELAKITIVKDDIADVKEVDHKLVRLSKLWKAKLLTVDFNLGQLARAQGVKVLNINDLAQSIKLSIIPGEELTVKITHPGKEREQGVGYLSDGTMIVVDSARDKVGLDVVVVVSKVHQTPAGQLFFARLK